MNLISMRRTTGAPLYLNPIVAIIVDDHPLAADGLKSYLETDPNIQVAAICHNATDALDAIYEIEPDIVLLDMRLDGSRMDGVTLAQHLRQDYSSSRMKILVISAYPNPQYVFGALNAQVNGYLIKTSSSIEIIESIYAVMRGVGIWDSSVQLVLKGYYQGSRGDAGSLRAQDILEAYHSLTKREKHILILISENLDYENDDLAEELYIAPGTVKTHITNILKKLSLKDKKELRVWYLVNQEQIKSC